VIGTATPPLQVLSDKSGYDHLLSCHSSAACSLATPPPASSHRRSYSHGAVGASHRSHSTAASAAENRIVSLHATVAPVEESPMSQAPGSEQCGGAEQAPAGPARRATGHAQAPRAPEELYAAHDRAGDNAVPAAAGKMAAELMESYTCLPQPPRLPQMPVQSARGDVPSGRMRRGTSVTAAPNSAAAAALAKSAHGRARSGAVAPAREAYAHLVPPPQSAPVGAPHHAPARGYAPAHGLLDTITSLPQPPEGGGRALDPSSRCAAGAASEPTSHTRAGCFGSARSSGGGASGNVDALFRSMRRDAQFKQAAAAAASPVTASNTYTTNRTEQGNKAGATTRSYAGTELLYSVYQRASGAGDGDAAPRSGGAAAAGLDTSESPAWTPDAGGDTAAPDFGSGAGGLHSLVQVWLGCLHAGQWTRHALLLSSERQGIIANGQAAMVVVSSLVFDAQLDVKCGNIICAGHLAACCSRGHDAASPSEPWPRRARPDRHARGPQCAPAPGTFVLGPLDLGQQQCQQRPRAAGNPRPDAARVPARRRDTAAPRRLVRRRRLGLRRLYL
jgi:hypothetical protein